MNKILSVAFLIFLASCGSSEAETQERIDEGVEEAVAGESSPETTTTIPKETTTTMQDTTSTTSTTSTTMPMKNISKSDTLTNTDSFFCEDKGNYVYCASSEAAVAPYNHTDLQLKWGVKKGYSPEVFCASDLQDAICPNVMSALLAAMIEWGNYEPVEYWVIGPGKEATLKLVEINCERRKNRGHMTMVECTNKHANENNWFEFYRLESEKVGSVSASAAHVGHDEWGFHLFNSSSPNEFTLDKCESCEPEVDIRIIFHEYFHGVQSSFKGVGEIRSAVREPDWFIEGSAEYMALITSKKAIDSNLLIPLYISESYVARDQMERWLKEGKESLSSDCPGSKLQDLNYGNQCNAMYSLGAWAVAYLANEYGEDLLLESLYANLSQKPNFEVGFKDTYGISLEEFYIDFDKFITDPTFEPLIQEILGNI